MEEYAKIETLFDRDAGTFRVIPGAWRLEEFQYLADNPWIVTEKVDGTNIRVIWDGSQVIFKGRSDNAQMPVFLFEHLQRTFTPNIMTAAFGDSTTTLYGEGYGARIQKGGGLYIPNGVRFILFDVKIAEWWLQWNNVKAIAAALNIPWVPELGVMPLQAVAELVSTGLQSLLKDGIAEGVVVRPKIDLTMRNGKRVIAKLKGSDYK